MISSTQSKELTFFGIPLLWTFLDTSVSVSCFFLVKLMQRMSERKWMLYYRNSFKQRESQRTIFEVVPIIKTSSWLLFLSFHVFLKKIFTELYRHVAIIDNVKALVRCLSYHLFTWPVFAHVATGGHLLTRNDFSASAKLRVTYPFNTSCYSYILITDSILTSMKLTGFYLIAKNLAGTDVFTVWNPF